MFTDLANPFGANAYEPAAVQTPAKTLYYKGLRLAKAPVKLPRTPKPPSHHVKNFLLNFNG